jgi:hypothetical protein
VPQPAKPARLSRCANPLVGGGKERVIAHLTAG